MQEILEKYQAILNTLDDEATWEDVASVVSKHFSAEECFLIGLQTGLQLQSQTISFKPDKTIN